MRLINYICVIILFLYEMNFMWIFSLEEQFDGHKKLTAQLIRIVTNVRGSQLSVLNYVLGFQPCEKYLFCSVSNKFA